jgi:hypothetical protein
MMHEDNQCERIFHELVDKKCIVVSKIIKESNKCDYFQAVPPNRIEYHPDMKGIHQNSITFCLLHEENHNRLRGAYWLFYALLIIVTILTIFVLNIYLSNILSLAFILIIIGGVIFHHERSEEYRCDEFAALAMKNKLKIQEQPSEILRKTLEIMPYRWWSAVIHPSHTNRVKNIFEEYDEKL